jgi:hypothetical protein
MARWRAHIKRAAVTERPAALRMLKFRTAELLRSAGEFMPVGADRCRRCHRADAGGRVA